MHRTREVVNDFCTRVVARDFRYLARSMMDRLFAERVHVDGTPIPQQMDRNRGRARERWLGTSPDRSLTWGRLVSGNGFISKVTTYAPFRPGASVLEVGPGYGRLLRAMFDLGVPFGHYVGLDLSEANILFVRRQFTDPRVEFVQGDIESTIFASPFDVVLSSLVFKHLYPSFERALKVVSNVLSPGGTVFFDLREGQKSYFQTDGVTFVRFYARPEIAEILRRCGLELVAFDEVQHDEAHTRLLVVTRKPPS